jgi:hypothetical protein
MKLLLKAYGDLDFPSTAQYAFLDLTPDVAQTLLKKRDSFQLISRSGDELVRILYWGSIQWFGSALPKTAPTDGWPAAWALEDYEDPSEGFLRSCLSDKQVAQLQKGDSPIQVAPTFLLPAELLDDVEMGMLQVEESGVRYRAYPAHGEHIQDTDEIPWPLIEQALASAA